jgi:hypothetical protein
MKNMRWIVVAVFAAVLMAVAVGTALGGEVKGPGTFGAAPTTDTAAPDHANSICAFSGLNDFNQGQQIYRTQTPANQGNPGDPGTSCHGGSNFERGTGG